MRRQTARAQTVLLPSLLGLVASTLAGCSLPAPPKNEPVEPRIFETHAQAATLSGFADQIVFQNRTNPIAVRFATNGKIFVAEEAGRIWLYDNLTDTTPTLFTDLRNEVNSYWDRGMLGFTLDPNYASNGHMYVLYNHDTATNGENNQSIANRNTIDSCPTTPGGTGEGCVTYGRISRLTDPGSGYPITARLDMVTEWPQQFPSHAIGGLAFGPDGQLYATSGDGAAFNKQDWGQFGIPKNPLGNPPGGVGGTMSLTTSRGGSTRSQSFRRASGLNVVLNGSLIRINPGSTTGDASAGNPNLGHSDVDARRIIALGLRNPYRFTFHPITGDIWIGDVGDNTWEEINRVPAPLTGTPMKNFGWPCFEGSPVKSSWSSNSLCTSGSFTHTPPYYAYNHSSTVYSGDACPSGSSAISGLAFYPDSASGNYPTSYRKAMFFADLPRDCIYVVFPGADGLPNMSTRTNFISAAANPVDLVIGPGNDLFYVDYGGDGGTGTGGNGRIHRVRYQAPTAIATANPTSGFTPLTVQFNGSMSTPGIVGDTLTYAWDLDGDGQFDDSTAQNPSRTYNSPATIVTKLKVTDQRGGFHESNSITITAGATTSPPQPFITTPSASLTWKIGDTISFSGGATDAEDGNLGPAALSWELVLMHCPSNCHEHPIESEPGVSSGTFPVLDHDYPSHLQLRLTATDSHGMSTTVTRDLQPETWTVNVQASPVLNPGLELIVGIDSVVSPHTRQVIKGGSLTLGANTQTRGSTLYTWQSWSQGGTEAAQTVTVTGNTTYTATFSTSPAPVTWVSQDVGAVAAPGSWSESNGTHTIAGNGADIWNAADEFRFTHQQLTGDGTITAKVNSFTNPSNVNGKAGVMMRQSLNANSVHIMAAMPPGGTTTAIKAIKRTATGATSVSEVGPAPTFPRWVRLTRVGSTVTAYQSSNGTMYTQLGTPITLSGTIFVGMAVSSHTDGTNGTAVFQEVAITTPAPPGAPSGLTASGGVNQAVLNWTDNANNETGFKIERKVATAADSTYAQVGTTGANVVTFTNTSVPAGDYSYRVRANNANGDSAYSNVATTTVNNPSPPMAPSGLTANGGVSQAVLGWTDNSSSETGFKIERKVSGADDSTYAEVGTVGVNVVTFTNTGVPGGVYTYRVKATSAVGDSGYSNSTDATITDPPPPAAPSNLTANGGVSQAVLNWTDNANNETGFEIDRKLTSDPDTSFAQVGTAGVNAQTFTNTGVPGGAYTYRVRATNTVGDSGNSNTADAVITDPQPPAAPSDLTVTGGVGQATLNWLDNANNETGFEIDRKLATDPDTSFAQVGTAAANAQSFTNTSVPAGTYSYRVRATNAVGDSGNSNSADATVTAPSGPAAPSNLAASTSNGNAAVLTWTDNSGNETGFRVEKKVGGGAFATLFTTAANVVTYTDGSLAAGTYTYRVLATGSPVSGPSNEVVVIINNPVADSYVREGTNAGINYGTETAIRVKLNTTVNNNRRGYVRFSLAGVAPTVTSAKLRLYGVATTNPKNVNVHAVSNTTWIESGTGGITFSNAPAMGAVLLGKNITTTAAYVEWDITAHIQAQRTANASLVSLGLMTTSNFPDTETVINSRENAANKPILIISSK